MKKFLASTVIVSDIKHSIISYWFFLLLMKLLTVTYAVSKSYLKYKLKAIPRPRTYKLSIPSCVVNFSYTNYRDLLK